MNSNVNGSLFVEECMNSTELTNAAVDNSESRYFYCGVVKNSETSNEYRNYCTEMSQQDENVMVSSILGGEPLAITNISDCKKSGNKKRKANGEDSEESGNIRWDKKMLNLLASVANKHNVHLNTISSNGTSMNDKWLKVMDELAAFPEFANAVKNKVCNFLLLLCKSLYVDLLVMEDRHNASET